jgi:hypothetical protein
MAIAAGTQLGHYKIETLIKLRSFMSFSTVYVRSNVLHPPLKAPAVRVIVTLH